MLSMVIIPAEVLNPSSYASESHALKTTIKEFNSAVTRAGLTTYVLCPVGHYSIERHVNSANADLPVYGGGQLSMVLAGITISLPMFRSLLNQLSEVKADVSNISVQVSTMQKQVDTLQKQVDNIQRQLIEQKLEQQRLAQAQAVQAAKLKEMEFRVLDPLMFAIKSFDISGNDPVLIGPCWGPDFDDIMETLAGNIKIKDQRKVLTNHINKLWGD